eukprot:131027_1
MATVCIFNLLYLYYFLLNMGQSDDDECYDVLVLGAGMSGITAAITLFENDITNIAILEAQDYIGGRMKTIQFNGYGVNIGATWIVSTCYLCNDTLELMFDTNPILQLATQYNITSTFSDCSSETYVNPLNEPVNHTLLHQYYHQYHVAESCVESQYWETIGTTDYDPSKELDTFRSALLNCGWPTPSDRLSKFVVS